MPKRSYKAVFFDLDGTLLPIDMDAFLKNYFNDIAAFVQARGHDPKQFIDALSAGERRPERRLCGEDVEGKGLSVVPHHHALVPPHCG